MRQKTAIVHTKPWKVLSVHTHMGLVSWDPHAVGSCILGGIHRSTAALLLGLHVAKLPHTRNLPLHFWRNLQRNSLKQTVTRGGPMCGVVQKKWRHREWGKKPAHLLDEECRQQSWKHLLWFSEAVAVERARAKAPISPVLWDVQVGKADRQPPSSWAHFSESFNKKLGLQ